MRPWWEEDPALLARELKSLAGAGFTLIHRGIDDRHNLRLAVARKKRRYELIFEDNYARGGVVIGRSLGRRRVEGFARVDVASGPGLGGATLALRRVDELVRRPRAGLGGRVLLPTEWGRPLVGNHGTIEFGLARNAAAILPLRLTGVDIEASQRLTAASAALADSFPDRMRGLWVSAPRLVGTEVQTGLVSHVEEMLAEAHGLELPALRLRLRTEVGAMHVATGWHWTTWQFVRRGANGEALAMETVQCDPRSFHERAPYADALAARHVAIVGCGAVGWTVAILLARSGVRRFTLYDSDRIDVGNLARLGAFVTDAGTSKVQTLADQLQAITPGITVRRHVTLVGRGVGAAALVAAKPDLLVNLTGEEVSTDETNNAALQLGVPAVFAWVSYGVAAARIFRVRPFASACYECVRESGPQVIRSYGRIQPGDVRPWRGSVIDVEAFAAVVAQVAVRTLRAVPASHANPDHLLVDFGGLAPRARRVDIPRDPRCAVCR